MHCARQTLSHLVLKVLRGKDYYVHVTAEKNYHRDTLSYLAEPGLYLFIFTYFFTFHGACKMVLNDGV